MSIEQSGTPDRPGPLSGVYTQWARLTKFAFLPRTENGGRSVLLALSVPVKEFVALLASGRSATRQLALSEDVRRQIRVPAVFTRLPAGLDALKFCAAEVTEAFFTALETDATLRSLVLQVEIGLPGMPNIDLAFDLDAVLPAMTLAPSDPRPARPVVAVIDDGIAFAHARFRRADGSPRIDWFWDMDNPAGSNPAFFGRQFGAADIAALMAASTHAGVVDEDEVYRRAGLCDFATPGHKSLALRLAHGTHVMDAVCGADPASKPAASADADDEPHLIAVQLPSRAIRDTSGASLSPFLLFGILYVLVRAHALAPPDRAPGAVTINLSVGMLGGPHDGTTPFDEALDALVAQWNGQYAGGVSIVMPSGNNLLARGHAQFTLDAGAAHTLRWRILPDDATPSFLEIWLPAAPPGVRVAVGLKAPGGATIGPVGPGAMATLAVGGRDVAFVVSSVGAATRDGVLVIAQPTTSHDAADALAPAGLWEVVVKRVDALGADAVVDAWIRRDDTPIGFPVRGRQSRFEDPAYERFDARGAPSQVDTPASWVKRDGTVNGFATGASTVVVAGWRVGDGAMAPYAAAGPASAPAARLVPDVAARSDDSVSCHGIIAAGARSGSRIAMWGTSVAAPQVARWLAAQPIASSRLPNATAQGEAVEDEWVVQIESPSPPATRMGAGRMQLAPVTSAVDRKA